MITQIFNQFIRSFLIYYTLALLWFVENSETNNKTIWKLISLLASLLKNCFCMLMKHTSTEISLFVGEASRPALPLPKMRL